MRRFAAVLLALAVTFSFHSIHSQAQSVRTHHVRDVVRNGQAQMNGRLPASQIMHLDLVLPLRNEAALDALFAQVNDPASPQYHHFLTPSQFTAQFGPTQSDYDAVVHFAIDNGFAVTGGSRDGMDVQVSGRVSAVESAFHLTMRTYKHPTEARNFYGPDSEPTTGLTISLWHISGLDNYSIPQPLHVNRNDFAAANGITPEGVVNHATTGSGPSASFLGSDMRAAYYGSGSFTGAGQSVGLLEYYGTDLADVNTYYANIGQTNNVPITLVSTDGSSTSCLKSAGCDDIEQTLDITQALGMAPGLSSLVVYIGGSDTAMISAMTTHNPLPLTIGCSWGWKPADPSTLDPYFKKMGMQGQTFLAASGDNSTWTSTKYVWPADDAYVVSVGGTDLITAAAGSAWSSETAWVDSGGGISPDGIAIPSWQQLSGVINSSNRGSTTLRNGPDVSANANFTFYTCGNQTTCLANTYGGTSFAAPMWAGYLALVNQQLAANSQPPVGFINPTIYNQNITSSYAADFHDITSGTSGSYSSTTGYDLVTGWGSPNAGLIAALVGTPTPSFSISASPTSVSVVQGNSGTSTITSAVSGGFNGDVSLAATGQPAGVTVSFDTNPIAAPGSGTSLATFAVASSTATGTYTITLSGTNGGVNHTATVSLTVTAAPVPNFSISASPASISVVQGNSGTSTLTTTVSGGFNNDVSLSATGQPAGVTVSFGTNPIVAPGSGTSVATFTVDSSTAAGTYTITLTGVGGGITHSTTVSLTVTSAVTGDFIISASPTSLSLKRSSSGSSTLTTGVTGSFSSALSLSASGQGGGITVSFSPSTIAAPGSGSSIMTVTTARNAGFGTHTITITATGGGRTHTTTVAVTVSK